MKRQKINQPKKSGSATALEKSIHNSFTISAAGIIDFTNALTCPISSSPAFISPSNMPFFRTPAANNVFKSSPDTPWFSACSTLPEEIILQQSQALIFQAHLCFAFPGIYNGFFKIYMRRCFFTAHKWLPTCTPSAPITIAASICLPLLYPPAAINGIPTAALTAGINTMLVVSSLPLCPPASNLQPQRHRNPPAPLLGKPAAADNMHDRNASCF